MELLALGALIMAVMVWAQIAERHPRALKLLRGLHLLLGLMLVAVGVGMMLHPDGLGAYAPDAARLGGLAVVSGVVLLLPLYGAQRIKFSWWQALQLDRPTPLVTWALLTLFLSSNVAMVMVKSLDEALPEHPLSFLWLQNIFVVVLVLVGVGWGFRRSGGETARRLGLERPTFHTLLLGVSMALIMMITTGLVGGLVALISGGDYGNDFNQQIIGRLPGVWGVISMGVATGLGEEVLFRGALQPVLGVGVTSLLFALSHAQYFNPAWVIIFTLGLLLGFTRKRWGLGTAILAHAVYNMLIGLLALWAMNF